MNTVRCLALFLLALVSGCYTVELSDTTYPEDRVPLRGGPGARQGELARIIHVKRTHYVGENISFGLMPGMSCMANDFGGSGGYIPATAMCFIIGPFVNACALATPTLCTLFVEPFTMTSDKRGQSWDAIAMGFVGTYRWRVIPHDETSVKNVEDVLIDGGYRPDVANIRVSKSPDGTKRWHGYPGYQTLARDVARDGKVDVLFTDGGEFRRFRKAKYNPGCLAFEDRAVVK